MIDEILVRANQTEHPTMPTIEESQTIEDQLRAFRRRCFLFAVPLLLCAAPAIGILLASNESFVDVDSIIERSDDEQFLVGFAYNEHNYGYLKYRRLTTLPRQSVVALGSSRVLGFREEMFTGSFYNAGYTIVSPWDFRSFLQLVPDSQLPDIVILGLDQFMFNAANNRQRQPKETTSWTAKPRDDLHAALQLIPDVYKDLVRGRIAIGAVLANATGAASENETRTVGLNGLINDCGSSDEEAIDGFHAGEVTYLKMVIQMLQRGSALNQFADIARLQNDVLRVVDRYTPYPEPHGAARKLAVGGTVGVVQ